MISTTPVSWKCDFFYGEQFIILFIIIVSSSSSSMTSTVELVILEVIQYGGGINNWYSN